MDPKCVLLIVFARQTCQYKVVAFIMCSPFMDLIYIAILVFNCILKCIVHLTAKFVSGLLSL